MKLFELFGTIAIDHSGANRGLDAIAEKASGVGAVLEKVGSAAVAAGKVIATGMAAGAAAVGALTKAAVDGYADYEQLVGGVETLFKDSAGAVKEYAANAYKTAGMSANEYMDTVTSFSASLLQSLGGDTAAAADLADRAIRDMSDNANKMGTSISSIQTAYQGFAKQNYSMLDNLKLGYGGTAAEMYRLMQRAAELDESFAATAEFSLDTKGHLEADFADIVKAIGIIQDEMGITGTTAREAAETISGSLASAKSAWQNLMVGMADDGADLKKLIDQFVESVGIAAENVIPRVEIALNGAAQLIDRLFPVIVEKIPAIINNVLPQILNSAVSIVQNLVNGISGNKETIVQTIMMVGMVIVETIMDLLPDIFALGIDLLLSLADGILANLDTLIDSALEMVGKIIETITNPNTLEKLLTAAVAIIVALAGGLVEYLPKLVDASISVVRKIVEVLTQDDVLDKLLDATIAIVQAIAEGIVEYLPELIDAAAEIIIKLVEYILEQDNLQKIIGAAIDLLGTLVEGLLENVGTLIEAAEDIAKSFIEAILEVDWLDVGWQIISGIGEGLIDAWNNFTTKHSGAADFLTKLGSAVSFGGSDALVGTLPSHADGLDYVPYDGYVAELHRGEMVVPAAQSQMLRSGFGGSDEVLYLLERIVDYFPQLIEAAGHDIVANDGTILARYAPMMNAELGRISARKERGR